KEENGVISSKYVKYKVDTVVDTNQDLKIPWAIDWLPDGRMLVTNRPGRIVVVKDGKVQMQVDGIPTVRPSNQGGLLDISLPPDYAKTGWFYITFSDPYLIYQADNMT